MHSSFKNFVWYTIPFLFRNLIPLISLPFFTRYLSPSDFGNLALSVIYGVLLVGLSNLGLISIFERNYFEYKESYNKLKLMWTCLTFVLINILVGLLFTFLFEKQINFLLFGKSLPDYLTLIATTHLGFKSLLQFFYIYLRNAKKASLYSLISILEATVCTVLSIYLVFQGKDIIGYIQGQSLGVFILFISITIFSIFRRKVYFNLSLLKQNLPLSLPLTPTVFFGTINTQFDRYMLGFLNTIGGVGVYDIGQKIANLGFLFITVLQQVYAPNVYSSYVNSPKKFSKHIGKYLGPFFYISFFFCLLLGLFSKEIIFILTTPKYYEAYQIIIILNMLYATYFFGKQPQLILAKKTKLISFLSLLGMSLNIIINFPLIKFYGVIGAALGTFLANMITSFISFLYAQKYAKIEYNKFVYFIFIYFQFSLAFILCVSILNLSYLSILIFKIIIISGFVWLGFKSAIISKRKIKELISIIK